MFLPFRSGLFLAIMCGSACIAQAQANRFVSNDVCKDVSSGDLEFFL